MAKISLKKGAQLCALFFFLQGCCKPCDWDLESIQTRCPEFNSSRLHSLHKANYLGLELEIVRSTACERVYLNIHGCPLPCGADSAVQVQVEEQEKVTIQATLFEGGQRLLLEDSGAQMIIQALCDGLLVTLQVGQYTTEFSPGNFGVLYIGD